MRILVFLLLLIPSISHCQEIELEFIAMQYYAGIMNRSFVVQVSDSIIFAGRVRGPIAAGVSRWNSRQVIEDPYFYANKQLLEVYEKNDGRIDPKLVQEDKANFLIQRNEIKRIEYTPKRKWGMGDVVHSGRIFITLKDNNKIELILLGKPDVNDIIHKLGINFKE